MDQSDNCYVTEMIEVNIYTNFLLIYIYTLSFKSLKIKIKYRYWYTK